MKQLKENISDYQFHSPDKIFRAEWEVLAEEMSEYFGMNCYWIFRYMQQWKIRDAYEICQRRRNRSFRYMMGVIRNLK